MITILASLWLYLQGFFTKHFKKGECEMQQGGSLGIFIGGGKCPRFKHLLERLLHLFLAIPPNVSIEEIPFGNQAITAIATYIIALFFGSAYQ